MRPLRERVLDRLPRPLTHVVIEEEPESASELRRRRTVVAGVSTVGAGLLGYSLSTRPGSRSFYTSTFAVAATWLAGGALSGPLHRGWLQSRDDRFHRPVLTPIATGVVSFGFFYGAALLARRIPVLDSAVSRALEFAEEGSGPLVLTTTLANGLGEEVFFRGSLYRALGERHPVALSTAIYAVSTTTTRNPALVLAATVMGTLFGLQRRATGGVQAPLVTHLTWSTLMLGFLPRVFRNRPHRRSR